MEKIKTAFILAGGKGSRLKPITYEIPKPLIPINDKPILVYNIENVKNFGVEKVVLGVGHMSEKIKKYAQNNDLGVEIIFSQEEKPLGTAGALKLAEENFNETFIMCNGDELKDINYGKLFQLHKENNAIGSIALTAVENISTFGVVELEGNRIQQFIEKPKEGKTNSRLINTGAYILEPKVLDLIESNKETSIEKEIFPKLVEEKSLYGAVACNAFYPIDTLDKYEHALLNWNKKV